MKDLKWLDEKVKDVPSRKGLFNFIKIFLFKWKGISYKEFYLILRNIYKRKNIDEKTTDKKAFEEILRIYQFNNKELPNELNNE